MLPNPLTGKMYVITLADILYDGSVTVWIAGLTVSGSGRDAFTVIADDCWLESGYSAPDRVRFRPQSPGPALALLVLHLQDSLRSYDIPIRLAGAGQEATAFEESPEPNRSMLGSIHPQPAYGIVAVPISLSAQAHTVLEIRDILGRRAALLWDGVLEEGAHTFVFDTRALRPGAHFAVLDVGNAAPHSSRMLITGF